MSDRSQFSEEQLEVIGDYVKRNLGSWLREVGPQSGQIQTVAYTDPQLIERIATVETELKAQRDLMQQGFEQMEKRFEQVDRRLEEQRADMNDRFEQLDRRFEEQRADMNDRFEQVDKRLEEQRADMNDRFEQVDRRFEEQRADMNDRFNQVDKRFDDMHRHTSRWMTALMIVVALTSLAATVTNVIG
jgi:DNA anti-recombination protein RmuC